LDQQEDRTSQYRKYNFPSLSENFSDEEMARDWTLSNKDILEIQKFKYAV